MRLSTRKLLNSTINVLADLSYYLSLFVLTCSIALVLVLSVLYQRLASAILSICVLLKLIKR